MRLYALVACLLGGCFANGRHLRERPCTICVVQEVQAHERQLDGLSGVSAPLASLFTSGDGKFDGLLSVGRAGYGA